MLSGIHNVAALIAVVGASITGYIWLNDLTGKFNSVYEQVEKLDKLRSEVANFESRISDIKKEVENIETIRSKLIDVDQKQIQQNQAISQFEKKSEVVDTIKERVDSIEDRLSEHGTAISEKPCRPLNKRITLAQHSSVEFCGSSLIVSVSEIRLKDNTANLGHIRVSVPWKGDQGFRPCTVNLMSIDRSSPKEPTLDLRANCPPQEN